MKLEMSTQIKREPQYHHVTSMVAQQTAMPIVRKSAFFSIDQILGNKQDVCVTSDDDDVFGKDISDSDSFDGDKLSIDPTNIEDLDESELVDEPGALDDVDMGKADSDVKEGKEGEKNDKQTPSYTAIIAQAILSSSDKKLPLGCIYEYIAETFPEFLKKGQGWRNCVRHNLSLSECFIKAGRARNGRGNYWGIHPRYIKNFSKGDFRKRRASHRPRNRELSLGYGVGRYYPYYFNPYGGYVAQCGYNKQPIYAPHRPGFSVDNILSKEQRRVDALAPPVLSNYKYYKSSSMEPGHLSPVSVENRSNVRLYAPPVLSSVVPPQSTYTDHYGYATGVHRAYADHHHHGGRQTTDCSCHKHGCRSPPR